MESQTREQIIQLALGSVKTLVAYTDVLEKKVKGLEERVVELQNELYEKQENPKYVPREITNNDNEIQFSRRYIR